MEFTLPNAARIAPDCLSMLAVVLACRRSARLRLPIELRLLGALIAELAGWAADEWADRRARRSRRGRPC